ncbi:plasmid stability protein [Actinoalloteichus hoggarensis]|nr:hypothetical protein [Actinoalloteichus hoggarensis]MBB5919622.1 plasmid stability protein [Actinoalloteichus hoggarensis]
MGKTVQIRDLDDEAYTVMRTRAAREHLSLSAYLRRQIESQANSLTMEELLARADRRRAHGMGTTPEQITDGVRAARHD